MIGSMIGLLRSLISTDVRDWSKLLLACMHRRQGKLLDYNIHRNVGSIMSIIKGQCIVYHVNYFACIILSDTSAYIVLSAWIYEVMI